MRRELKPGMVPAPPRSSLGSISRKAIAMRDQRKPRPDRTAEARAYWQQWKEDGDGNHSEYI